MNLRPGFCSSSILPTKSSGIVSQPKISRNQKYEAYIMPKLTYRIENAPGRVYGKNSNELVFKEPSSNALIYSTATESTGLLTKTTKKQLYRGPAGEKEGGVCVATIDEPSHAADGSGGGKTETLEMHHHHHSHSSGGEDGGATEETESSSKLRVKKTSSWVPLVAGGDSHALTFRGAGYTWTGGRARLRRDADGRTMARVVGPWFWEGKVGELEVDVPEMGDEDERRDLLEVVLATFVARWWGDKAAGEARAREAQRVQAEKKKAKEEERRAAAREKAEEQKEKKEEEEQEGGKKAGQGAEQLAAAGP